jgi:hypothetical protein
MIRSGRTEKMLHDICSQIKNNKKVIILTLHERQIDEFKIRLTRILNFESVDKLREYVTFTVPNWNGVDLRTGRAIGMSNTTSIVYADHSVFEQHIGSIRWLFDQWKKWSVDSQTEGK